MRILRSHFDVPTGKHFIIQLLLCVCIIFLPINHRISIGLALFASLGSLVFIYRHRDVVKIRNDIIFKLVLFCISLVAIAMSFNESTLRNFDNYAKFLFLLPVYLYLKNINIKHDWFLGSMLLAIVYMSVITYLNSDAFGRQVLGYYNPISLGVLAGLFFVLMLSVFITNNNSRNAKVISLISMILLLFPLALGAAKIALLAVMASILVTAFILRKKYVLLFLCLPLVLLFFENILSAKFLLAIDHVLCLFDNTLNCTDGSVGVRYWMITAVLNEIEFDNVVFGFGGNGVKEIFQTAHLSGVVPMNLSSLNDPHFDALKVFSDAGLLGLFAMTTLILYPLFGLYRHNNKSAPSFIFYLSGVTFFLIVGVGQSVFGSSALSFLIALFFMLTLGSSRRKV